MTEQANPLTTPQDVNDIHRKLCPKKSMSNFWRSEDFKIVEEVLKSSNQIVIHSKSSPYKGSPARTMVHPLVALSFLRWADPKRFYVRLNRVFTPQE